MNFRTLIVVCAVSVPLSTVAWGVADEDTGGTESGLARLLRGLTEGTERAWAKPIEEIDMDRMRELLEMGLVTFHEAEWYVEVEEDE